MTFKVKLLLVGVSEQHRSSQMNSWTGRCVSFKRAPVHAERLALAWNMCSAHGANAYLINTSI